MKGCNTRLYITNQVLQLHHPSGYFAVGCSSTLSWNDSREPRSTVQIDSIIVINQINMELNPESLLPTTLFISMPTKSATKKFGKGASLLLPVIIQSLNNIVETPFSLHHSSQNQKVPSVGGRGRDVLIACSRRSSSHLFS